MKRQKSLIWAMILALLAIGLPIESFAQKTKGKPTTKTTTKAAAKKSPADVAFAEGEKLFAQATAASYQAALAKFIEAAELFEQKNNAEWVAESYLKIGRIYRRLNNLQLALVNYEKAYQFFDSLGDNEGRAATYNNIAVIFRDEGQFNESLKYYQSALPLMRATKNKKGEAQVLNGIGESFFGLGNAAAARQHFQQADAIWQSLASNEDKVRTTYNLGRVSFAFNEIQPGLNYLNKSLAESRQFDNPILEGDILEFLAMYHLHNGELAKAIEYRQRIFNAYSKAKASIVSPSRVLLSVNNLIVSYYRAGDFLSAFKYLEEGIAFGKRNNEVTSTALLYGNKGVLLVDMGNYSEGINFLNQGITASGQTNNKLTEAYFLASLGIATFEIGEAEQAINYLNQALQLTPAGSGPEIEGKVISGLIRVYASLKNKGKTQEAIRLAGSRKLDVGMNAGILQVLAAAGYAEHLFGNNKEGLRLLNLAFSIATKLNHEVEKAKILYGASVVYHDENDYQNALQAVQASHDFWKKIGNQSMDLATHYQMGLIFSGMNQTQASMDNFKTVLGFPEEVGMTDMRASSHLFLGLMYLKNKDFNSSLEHYNQASTLFESLGDKNNHKTSLNGIADVYEATKDKKKAKEFRDKAKKIKN